MVKGNKRLLWAGEIFSSLIFATDLRGGLNLGETEIAPLWPHSSSPSVLPVLGDLRDMDYLLLCTGTTTSMGRETLLQSRITDYRVTGQPGLAGTSGDHPIPGYSRLPRDILTSTPPATGPAHTSSLKAACHHVLVTLIIRSIGRSSHWFNLHLCTLLLISGRDSKKEVDIRKLKFCALKKQGRSEMGRVWCPMWAPGKNANKS